MEQGRRLMAPAAPIGGEHRLQSAVSVKPHRMAVGVDGRLRLGVAPAFVGVILIDPNAIEIFHQRPIQHVDPDHRIGVVIAVIVPGAVRRKHDVAAAAFAALALDIGVAALVGENGAAGVRAVHMSRRDVAVVVNGDGATDRIGDLQPAAEARIGQQNALAVGLLQRLLFGVARDLGDAKEVGTDFAPAPAMRLHLHLVDRDAPLGELTSAGGAARIGEPGTLRRRIRLGANPGIELGGLAVEPFHRFGRVGRVGRFCRDSHENPPDRALLS